ncbi:NAD(P)/FAD-dependent oxidoreductase [Maribacter algicola]|uniref:NAD(P)/FAD-dependent oxidoreductase n=1 Tax=Meishania litoralis TaxID=3434685 RepID=A0ACC7LLL3_9FLAO
MEHYDIIIIGAGLAGLTAAIDLRKKNHRVLVFEKNTFPNHKVCGEYVSNEVRPYLESLGVGIPHSSANIDTFTLSTINGKTITTRLPLGGFGISRYALDNLLYEKALASGVAFIFQAVDAIAFEDSFFEITTLKGQIYRAPFVIGAFGKRSNLDKNMKRAFIAKKSPWLGVKAHYDYQGFPENEVALHNFNGGYAGLSKTETGAVNFCYLTSYKSFQKERNITSFNEKVVAQNPVLNTFLKKAKPIFDEPLSIAQISFEQKKAAEDHVIMCGDSAGLIHPLCGNGMAMAVHSAKIASELIDKYINENGYDRQKFEKMYTLQWNEAFKKRLWAGRQLQSLLLNKGVSKLGMSLIVGAPGLLSRVIRATHGQPIV